MTEKRTPLQIVPFGQPELIAKIAQRQMRQQQQQITFADCIELMCAYEIGQYVAHWLHIAVPALPQQYVEPAIDELSRRSNGIARRSNVIVDKSMMPAFGEG